jgi:hypothetical protein
MPGVVIFNRYLPLAADDFLPLALIHSLLNSISFASVLYLFDRVPTSCAYSKRLYLEFQLCLSVLDTMLDILMMWMSQRGTIAYSKPRRNFGKILYVLICTIMLQLMNNFFGIVEYHGIDSHQCDSRNGFMTMWIVLIYWNLISAIISMIFIVLNLVSSRPFMLSDSDRPRIIQRTLQPLFWSAAYLNRNSPIPPKDILKDVAEILTELFGSRHMTVSDVLAGLILVRTRQLNESLSDETYSKEIGESVMSPLEHRLVRFGPASIDRFSPTIINIPKISYLSKYAEAIYGIPLYMFADMKRGLSYMCCPHTQSNVTSAVMAIERSMDTGCTYLLCCFPGTYIPPHEHPDLLYSSLKGRLFKSPFAVSVDHTLKAVVIATRGTMSTTDLLVDLYIKEQIISWHKDGETVEAITHHGIFQIASTIYNEIRDHGVFDLIQSRYPDFEIICTGHSLGAAVSSLLAFLIKTSEETQLLSARTIAICYSTPACMISKEAIPFFETFCTSVILGDDLICRLNPRNVHILRERISFELNNCHRKKFDLITSELINRLFASGHRAPPLLLEDAPTETIPDVEVETSFLPGNILHFIRSDPSMTSTETNDRLLLGNEEISTFQPYWVHPANLGKEIIISTSMAMDHLPNRVGNVLRSFLSPEDALYYN